MGAGVGEAPGGAGAAVGPAGEADAGASTGLQADSTVAPTAARKASTWRRDMLIARTLPLKNPLHAVCKSFICLTHPFWCYDCTSQLSC